MRRFTVLAMTLFTLTGAVCPKANEMEARDTKPADLRPPRDGNIAIREELDAARRAGTLEAYDLFLTRHGDHLLAETARRERALIGERAGK